MDPPEELASLERRVWRSTTDDGLIDLGLGLWIAGLGVALGTDLDALPAVLPPLLVGLWRVLRRTWIEPRAGRAVFAPRRRRRIRRSRLALALASAATLVLGLAVFAALQRSSSFAQTFRAARHVPLGLVLAALIAAGALQLELRRGLVWAGLVLLAFAAPDLAGFAPAPLVAAAGGLIALAGGVLLVRFLRAHPVVSGPDAF